MNPAEKLKNIPANKSLAGITGGIDLPQPIRDLRLTVLPIAPFANYFLSLYNSLVNALYPGNVNLIDEVCTPEEWITVCSYLLQARIDTVYDTVLGIRTPGSYRVPQNYFVPNALAIVINSIGRIIVRQGELILVPAAEDRPAREAEHLHMLINVDIMARFRYLILACEARGYIGISTLSQEIEGTGYWHVGVLTPNLQQADGNTEVVRIKSIYAEVTKSDQALAAIVQPGLTGLTPVDLSYEWHSDTIRGVASMREFFNLHA